MKDLDIDNKTGENHTGSRANTPVKLLTASSVIGDKIVNKAGEHLGSIKEIMLNLETEKIEYIIVEFGGFLGLGEKLFAFKMKDFSVDTDNHSFVLNRSKEELEKEPGFDKDHWPETNAHTGSTGTAGWGSFMGSNVGSEY
ncbi:MAG: PRC-barrel domain-containing protein [Chryseolinea sp.]